MGKFDSWTRRDILKGLAGIPIVGGVWWAGASDAVAKKKERQKILETLQINASPPPPSGSMSGDPIRIGLIGFGIRGTQLARALGFATNDWLEGMKKSSEENPNDTRLQDFLNQENLNVKLAAICDIFDYRANLALESFNTDTNTIKRFRTHQELIDSGEVDAVVIATPDHWHAPISIYALNAGVNVYVEKPMTHNIAETYALRDAVAASSAVFAVGHQHRQTQSFLTAQDVVKQKILGHVSLIQANTNRNSDNGAWQYYIHPDANPNTVDWKQFIGNAPMVDFNTEHFFRWRKWWAYGSGLSGDLMSHDYDRVNCVLNMGIPKSVTASGGIYTHKDGRNVPDVMQINMDFPDFTTGGSQEKGKEMGMTLVYSASLGNQYSRKLLMMGHDGTMELGNQLTIYADANSTRYADMLESGKMNPNVPIYQYDPAANGTDAVTSATAKYFMDKGLLYTYRDGKRVDSTFLHLREWLSCIRNGGTPSCSIKEGFEEAITAHMGGLSYKLGRRIDWDAETEKIVEVPGYDFDEVLLTNEEKIA
jgi:predicted dehydrogenase